MKAAMAHVEALGVSRVSIGVQDKATDRWQWTDMAAKDVTQNLPAYDDANRYGKNINIRAAGPEALNHTFVDDLKIENIAEMKNAGFAPAAVVETSPGNFQAWLKHHDRFPDVDTGRLAARLMAQKFHGDPGGAAWNHPGKLAGFSNVKPKHYDRETRSYPLVKLAEATGKPYSASGDFRQYLEKRIADGRKQEIEQAMKHAHLANQTRQPLTIESFYQRGQKWGNDPTRIDLAWAIHAIGCGMEDSRVAEMIGTRNLSHKGDRRRQSDYVNRTIRVAHRRVGR